MLSDLIIDQFERGTRWKGKLTGKASFRIEEEYYDFIEKKELILEAMQLEKEQLLKIRWVNGYYRVDIEKVEFSLENMEFFYKKAERTPKYLIMKQKMAMVLNYYDNIASPWIRKYTELEVIPKLQTGKDKQDIEHLQRLYQCFTGLDQLDAPIFKRIFSKKILKNSKIFEKKLQGKVIHVARKYHDEIEDTMEDSEVLSQLYIEEYAQELTVKGCLHLEVLGSHIDTGVFPYGTVLNTQTIKNAVILDNKHIKKILTIENKANYVDTGYEEGTLIIFCHGYFSPLERVFLIRLREQLKAQEVTYFHSGDLDYGGIRIFRYIRRRIFHELQPYLMDLETFEQYINFAEPIEQGPLQKIKNINEPMLQPLIDRIIETGLVIEQEAFL